MKGKHFAARLLGFVRPDVAGDVDEELQFHIESRVQGNIARGMTEADARRDALARFGDVALVRDDLIHHDQNKITSTGRRDMISDFLQDARFGLRSLRRAPSFAIAAILTLAFGIGANAAVFSIVDAIALRPLPYAEPERLMSVGSGSAGEVVALRERLTTLSLAAHVPLSRTFDDGGDVVLLEGAAITSNMLATLGAEPMLGRAFTDDDAILGKNDVMLLSHRLWQRQFAGARDMLGTRVLVEGYPHTIIGVMPPGFQFPNKDAQFWLPYTFNPQNVGYHWAVGDNRIIGRLADGVTIADAELEVRTVWPTLRTLNPLWDPGPNYRNDVRLEPLQHGIVGNASKVVWALFGCVLVVLLIGCVNVANLLLARASARDRELSVRAALGGGRMRLVRQLLTESLMLSTIGAALGVALAYGGVAWLVRMMPAGVPRVHEVALNGTVLAFIALVTAFTSILFGTVPALRATRFAKHGVGGDRRTTATAQHHRLAGGLVMAETALAVTLVISATLLVRSLASLSAVTPGFEPSHLIAARLTPPSGLYQTPDRTESFYDDVISRVSALPGVQSVGAVDKLPLAQPIWGIAVRVEGRFEDATRPLPDVEHWQMVTPAYFATMGMPVRGRAFTSADRADQIPVAIVNESFAKRFWPGEDAIGKRIGYPYNTPWLTIVGVVPDTKQDSLREGTTLSMYVPWQQRARMSGSEMWVVARTSGEPAVLTDAIRRAVREVDRAVPVSDVRTMDAVVSGSIQTARFIALLVSAFALGALLLGGIGIYGVMSHLVGQRTREMGIRIALGAPARGVIGNVVARAAALAGAGALAGVVLALMLTRSMGAVLYGISPVDPLTFTVVPAFFLLVAAAASYGPARRAGRVDPIRALRAD